jgi:UDP-GlcNAc:undecaprenyl-phosphate GlcNAc-1-phosphate transferase
MTKLAFLTHIIFASILFSISSTICMLIIKKMQVIDIPNHRSSHDTPTPTSGGIAIVATFIIGILSVYIVGDSTMIRKDYFVGFALSAILIAGVALYDDLRKKPLVFKLLSQLIGVFVVMVFGLILRELSLPVIGKIQLGFWGYIITFFWIIGLTNAYNFMDGIDGLAGGTAVLTSLFFCLICFYQGSNFVYIICYPLIAGSFGFFLFNFPKAKLFMGDVGSTFLGFTFAIIAIIAALYDHSHTSFFVMPLLLFNFIYDTFFTFICRLIRKKNVAKAHKRHLYQLFNRLGYSHMFVSCFHFAVCIVQGIGAFIMVDIQGSKRVLVFIPFLIFQILYSSLIIKKAKKAKLI